MQIFLPYPDPEASARVLSDVSMGIKHLPNQINEGEIILKTLVGAYPPRKNGQPGGWPYHAATRMCAGYEFWLATEYLPAIGWECYRRRLPGFKTFDDLLLRLNRASAWLGENVSSLDTSAPHWLGDPAFHASHRAALLFKDPAHYGQFQWAETPKLDYVWPTSQEEVTP